MPIREIRATGREAIYPDDFLISERTLMTGFGCSNTSIERAIKRARVTVEKQMGQDHMQKWIAVRDFPVLIASMQSTEPGKVMIPSPRVNTSNDFRIKTRTGTIFEYKYPQPKPLSPTDS